MIKKGINVWSFPAGISFKDMFTIAKDAGFEGIELSLSENGPLGLKSSEKEILEIYKTIYFEMINKPVVSKYDEFKLLINYPV